MKQIPILFRAFAPSRLRAFAPSRLRAFALACALPLVSWAQQTVSGTVTDDNGLPLPGATVVVQNTNRGTTTDFDGKYQIQAIQGETLTFSYVGYASQNITVGSNATINVQLLPAGTLEEVVVTGQNIEREARSLGYAVTSLGADAVQSKTEGDIGRILSGQVAGLNVIATSGISGSGTNIIIRGYSTITGSNQPLFVVDGIPYNSSTNNQSNFLDNSTESSRFFDIDPNLVENVSILKGLSATVLYGEEGRNGVILITTKNATKGEKAKGFEVSLDQSVFFSEAILPKYQNNYGGGFHQGYGFFFSNWGPRFDRTDGDLISLAGQFTGTDTDGTALLLHPFNFLSDESLTIGYENLLTQPYRYQPYNGVKDFFRTGQIVSTSLNLRGGTELGSFSLSYGKTEDEGVTPGNRITRDSFGAGGRAQLSNRMYINGSFNFTQTRYKTPPIAASFGSGVSFDGSSVFGDLLYTPRSVDLTNIPFQAQDGRSVYYRSGNDIQNPYWTVQNAIVTQNTDRFNMGMVVGYDLGWDIYSQYRYSFDSYTEFNSYGQNRGGVDGEITGIYRTVNLRNSIAEHTLTLQTEKELSENLNLKATVGLTSRRDTFEQDGLESVGQLAFGVLNHFNFSTNSARNSFSGNIIAEDQRHLNRTGVFLDAVTEYKDYLFLNLAFRNDWSNAVESDNNSILYPGISLSFVATDAFDNLKGSALNYLKARVGYGSSSNFPGVFGTRTSLGLNSRFMVDLDGNVISSNSVSNFLGNPNLKPEVIQEFELGIDAGFFNRFDLTASVYRRQTNDLITNRALGPETGATSETTNIGEIVAKGVEVDFKINMIKPGNTDGFGWNLSGNFTADETTVTELPEGTENILLTQAVIGNAANYAVEGRPFGVLLGTTIERDGNGNRVVGNNGLYIINNDESEIGDPNPDWRAAITNSLRYKGFSLSATLSYRHGGDVFSTTAAALIGRGVVDDDNPIDRESNFILPGVLQDGSPNNIAITATEIGFNTYFAGNSANETQIFDGSTFRIQEVSFGYDFPEDLLEKTFLGSLSINFLGRNLWYKAFNFPDNIRFDTNSLSTGVGNGQGIDFITGPSTRSYGLSISATF